jgi:signal transduction histidine kinase/CheY-like chemotaxis protein
MWRPAKSRQFRWAALAVALVGVFASMGAFAAATDSVNDTTRQLLEGDAAQGSLVLSELIDTAFDTPFQELGRTVSPVGVLPSVFDTAAKQISTASGSSIALLHEAGGQLTVVASVGTLHQSFAPGKFSSLVMSLATKSDNNFAGVFVASGKRWLEQVYGKGFVPSGFVIYSEDPITKDNSVTPLPGFLFGGTDAAAYVGSVSPSKLILKTSVNSPGGSQVAVSVVGGQTSVPSHPSSIDSPGNIIVAMSPKSNLAGTFTDDFPKILLLAGLIATFIFAWLLGLAVARRDKALGLVVELRTKNTELDQALARQAQAELRLRQAQRMEAVGQLAGGIAHDFNNLLQSIISYSDFLSEEIDPDSEMQKDVGEVQRAAHRAAELTRQLLVFSRQDITSPAVIDLNNVVHDAERFLRHTLGEDVALSCQTSATPCCILADSGELELMLMNLAINSRDAMPHGGNLVITVDSVVLDADAAQLAGVVPGTFAKLSVADNGEGMTPEVAAKAFEPFFTTKETGRGTGLGLAMVYGITVRWGGDASISTTVGVGTTITLLFPLSDEEASTIVKDAPKEAPRGDRDVVMLVEDQDAVRRSTARILEAAGYQVVQAETGLQALEICETTPIDILVTDLIMPGGVSGKQLADRLLINHPHLPVVFVSGYSSEIIAERGILPPSTNLVMKPFTPDELLEAVAHVVAQKV